MQFFHDRRMWVGIILLCGFCVPSVSFAREYATDWYIKNFDTQIVVNKDSTLDITEHITADCGNLPDKHGIFRVLPESIRVEGKKINTPVELISIADQNGIPYKFTESRNYSDDTMTWKIGDPNVTVSGVNEYVIHYKVKNVIRFDNAKFDELYWNLNGNFWDLETDAIHATITFPNEVTKDNAVVDYYTGSLGEKRKDMAAFDWSLPNVLSFYSLVPFGIREGITASVIFPKGIFVPYHFSFLELYGKFLWLLIPIVVFSLCFRLWLTYGKDPRVDKAVIPEYEAPGDLSPIEMGMLMTNGTFKNSLITAEIVNLATKGFITIKEVDNKILFVHLKDYELTLMNSYAESDLIQAQKDILAELFKKGDIVKLSSLKNSFYRGLPAIKKSAVAFLKDKGLITAAGLQFAVGLSVFGVVLMICAFFAGSFSAYLAVSLFVSGLVVFFFGIIMPKRTPQGAELNWQIKGFKLFMETVDKDRAAFYEKENMFEKFLPYAIMFGMTKLWIKRMQEIYGEELYSTHAPAWYVGSMGSFNADNFSSSLEGLSSAIAASTSSPSGSGGSGSAGGGGGGGGGGGW